MPKEFKKTFSEIRLPNKDIVIRIQYANNCMATFKYVFNSISGGYMGLMADSFIDSIRGLLYVVPDFFQMMDHSYEKELIRMGFEKIQPSENDTKHYGMIFGIVPNLQTQVEIWENIDEIKEDQSPYIALSNIKDNFTLLRK